jgi:hypothetical protein
MANRDAIKALVAELQIPYLVHFTRSENLPSIMENGLLPRTEFECEGVACEVNDELRLDGRLEAISLSIAFPNSRMLWALRQKHAAVSWAILAVSKSVLWENDCAFCKHNAADKRISTVPLDELQTVDALAGMYGEIPGRDRTQQNLKTYDPTDVQAEILAFGRIPPDRILGAVFQRPAVLDKYKAVIGDRKTHVHWDGGFFSDRRYNRTNS